MKVGHELSRGVDDLLPSLQVTFGKRRAGLFKKGFELGVLCQVDVAVLVWSHAGKLHA